MILQFGRLLSNDVQQSRRVKWKAVKTVCTSLFLARFPRLLDERDLASKVI
jgi:hypothetical protein